MTGLVIVAVVLLAATAFGLWRRATDGRMRAVGGAPGPHAGHGRTDGGAGSPHTGPVGADGDAGTAADRDAAQIGAVGVPVPVPDGSPVVDLAAAGPADLDRGDGALDAAALGAPLGQRATLVQFSTAFCQPCRATRRTLDEVAAMIDGVAHVEVDAESNLDLVRRFAVMRTPTVLVLDADGRVRRRASGQPRKADVIAALGEVVP